MIKKNLTKENLRGAEPLVFGHAELFLKARATTALIDHGWIGRLADGGRSSSTPFSPQKSSKNGWNHTVIMFRFCACKNVTLNAAKFAIFIEEKTQKVFF